MRKLSLHLEDLRVDTFDPLPPWPARVRTVRGHQDRPETDTCGEETCDSCEDTCKPPICGGRDTVEGFSCEGSCPPDTCVGHTCDGAKSCAGTCEGWTCEGTCGEDTCNSCVDTCKPSCGTTCPSGGPCCVEG